MTLAARHTGFTFLFVYVTAALGLLLTTSFLGLRRYLRQRYLQMPAMIAFGWVRFGVGIAALVLVGALLLPRPGANDAWHALRYHIDYQLRQASEYAARFSPHGKGQGRSGNETQKSDPSKDPAADSQLQPGSSGSPSPGPGGKSQDAPPPQSLTEGAELFYHLFKILFLLALAALAAWWLFRQRDLIFQIARSFLAALTSFFNDLFRFGSLSKETTTIQKKTQADPRLFASYRNPFLLGTYSSWTHEQLVLYSFEALQAWAAEQGVKPRPEQTAREFCGELGSQFPEIVSELNRLSFLYGHAAFGMSVPADRDLEPVRRLWRFLGAQTSEWFEHKLHL